MDSNGARRPVEESHHRELPQLSLRIAPLREPVSSRTLSAPSPLEPNASGTRESQSIPKANATTGSNTPSTTKEGLPTVTEFLNAARTKKNDPTSSSQSSTEIPKPILPAFVNLRALERVPFSSSFDDDALHDQRKRRRLELQAESFSEHLQLPIPQTSHKEQRPPPFGPFAILNGLNEPPPNAALLPPIEPGSINQLLTKPTRGEAAAAAAASAAAVDPSGLVSDHGTPAEGQPVERREAKIEELLGSTLGDGVAESVQGDGADPLHHFEHGDAAKSVGIKKEDARASGVSTGPPGGNEPLSPKSRGRSRKNVRKWTEEETIALLHGVVKCGIGNWTTILAQPELKFNKRTASNLKDRFRVCCPWAYRASDPNEAIKQLRDHLADALRKAQTEASDDKDNPGKTKLHLPNPVPVSSESSSRAETPTTASHKPSASSMSSSTPDTETGSIGTQKSPPAKFARTLSDESQSTLESLGIPEPHVAKKSKRRSRNPFTSAEDEALLQGYAAHGFQWTLIQQDSRLKLGHRRATDLRDRFRTKFPNAYRHGGSVSNSSISHPKQEPISTPVPMSRDRLPSAEFTPTKTAGPSRSGAHSRHPSSASHSNVGPLDPAFLPPPPGFVEPSASNLPTSGILSFPLDETPAGGSSPWEDNTLAPMVWDDLN